MIQTFSSTIRRKEMDAVLTCMVDEKTGPGELNTRFVQALKDFTGCDGAVAFRSPQTALSYAFKALDLEKGTAVMISALAPSWQFLAVENLGYKPLVLDVNEDTGVLDAEIVSNGIKAGGRLLILHETMGILPDVESIVALGVPVIEDISQSVGAVLPDSDSESDFQNENAPKNAGKRAGSFGVFTVLGLEEFDTVTGGGGAVLMAPRRRDWVVLKKYTDSAARTEILPDINSALAFVQLKEFNRNEQLRKSIFSSFQRAVQNGKNRTFSRASENGSTVWSFPVVLNGSVKDVQQYANRKGVEIAMAYKESVISLLSEDESSILKVAKSLFLRTVLFPLYPRLGSESVAAVAKILGTLP